MFTQITRLLSLASLLLICAACDLEVIPDNFAGGPDNGDPTACFTTSRSSCTVGECTIVFDALCSENETIYRWDFDNNGTFEVEGTGERAPSFTFTSAGTFTVRLEVQDNMNRLDDTTLQVVVSAMPINTFEDTDAGLGAANGLVVLSDGSLLMTGSTSNDVYLFRTDPDGNETLNRTYSILDSDTANDVLQLSDGTYVVAGSSFNANNGQSDAFYLRTNSSGDLLTGPFRFPLAQSNESIIRMRELPDGSVLMVGLATSTVSGNNDIYLLRYSPDLTTTHIDKTVTLPDSEIPTDVIGLSDGFIVVGKSTPGGGGAPRAMFARFDLQGNLTSGQPVLSSGGNGQTFETINRITDNDFFLAGLTAPDGNTDVLISRVDANGVPAAGYPDDFGLTAEEFITDGAATPDGGMILCGQQGADALLLKVNAAGKEAWRETNPVNNDDGHKAVAITPDGGYAVGGYRGASLYYAKTNSLGKID